MSPRTIRVHRVSSRVVACVLVTVLGLGLLAPAGARATGREPAAEGSPAPRPVMMAQAGTSPGASLDAEVDRLESLLEKLMEKFPTGQANERETAFSILFVSYFAVLGGSLSFPAAGAALGGGIGAIVGAAGWISGPGGAVTEAVGISAGAGIGGGAGLGVTVATVVGATLIMAPLAFYINERYSQTALAPWREGVLLASTLPRQVPVPRKQMRTSAQAGAWESMFIHLMDSYYSDKLLQLASAWEKMPGLTASQRTWLQTHDFLRPTLQRLAYIKEHKRLSANAPVARPLTGLMGDVIKLVTADSATMRQAWFNALGLVGLKARVSGGVLTLTTPAPLRQVGAAAAYKVDLPSIDAKVGGSGGATDPYVAVTAKPGPFDVTWGVPSLSGDRIRVTYEISKNSTLGQGSVRARWQDKSHTIGSVVPRALGDHTATVYFKPEGHLLLLDEIAAGPASVTLSMPSLDGPLASLQNLMDQLGGPFRTATGDLVKKQLRWSKVIENLAAPGTESLLRLFQSEMAKHGLLNPTQVQQIIVQAGQLRARVKTAQLLLPAPAVTLQEVVAAAKTPLPTRKVPGPTFRYQPAG